MCACGPSSWGEGLETGEFLELYGQSFLQVSSIFRERPCLRRWDREKLRKMPDANLFHVLIYVSIPVYTYTHAHIPHTHVHISIHARYCQAYWSDLTWECRSQHKFPSIGIDCLYLIPKLFLLAGNSYSYKNSMLLFVQSLWETLTL